MKVPCGVCAMPLKTSIAKQSVDPLTERRQEAIAVRVNKTGNRFGPLDPGFGRTLSLGKQEKSAADLLFAFRHRFVDSEVHSDAYTGRPHVEMRLSSVDRMAIELVNGEFVIAALEGTNCLKRTATIALHPVRRARPLPPFLQIVRGIRQVFIAAGSIGQKIDQSFTGFIVLCNLRGFGNFASRIMLVRRVDDVDAPKYSAI